MAENVESAGQRDRSPAHPIIPLEDALDRLSELFVHFKRTPARPDKVGAAWSITSKARVNRIAAALRYFGLLDYQGNGDNRRMVISDEGRKYLRTQQAENKRELEKVAALRPKEISKCWDEWGENRPKDAACLDSLMDEKGFSEKGARKFLKVYDETISFAGLTSSDKLHPTDEDGNEDGTTSDGPPEIEFGDLIQAEISGVRQFEKPKRVRAIQEHEGYHWVFVDGEQTGVLMEQAELVEKAAAASPNKAQALTPPVLPLDDTTLLDGWHEERLIDDSGEEIFVRFKHKPSSEHYAYIRDYYGFKLARMSPGKSASHTTESKVDESGDD